MLYVHAQCRMAEARQRHRITTSNHATEKLILGTDPSQPKLTKLVDKQALLLPERTGTRECVLSKGWLASPIPQNKVNDGLPTCHPVLSGGGHRKVAHAYLVEFPIRYA